ncbi:hypothetical protein DIS18_00565 [Algibacter marinivivus]|uniref:DUF6249 domain-containing protein n=1 Tax=Algibacter marinivivus TaxID=2100723 RepID=A0A2U2X5N0_9FLAO|nr:hypothetical protein DIS18_00565 [Algibacter marinivivus]
MHTTSNELSLIPFVVIFVSIITIIILFLRNRHKEKIELIKKGSDVIFEDIIEQMRLNNLGRGIILINLALGIFLGHLLTTISDLNNAVCYIGSCLMFLGIGSLLFYFILRNK